MEREVHQPYVDIKVPLQLFNTPGTEVAPGSSVVCEDFQYHAIGHRELLLGLYLDKVRKG